MDMIVMQLHMVQLKGNFKHMGHTRIVSFLHAYLAMQDKIAATEFAATEFANVHYLQVLSHYR